MLRVRLFAVTAIGLGAALAGCSSSGSTSGLFKSSPPPPQVLQFQSVPPGANVQTAQGQTCATPCSLAVPVTSQAVSFSLNGYVPQTIQIAVHQAEGSLFSTPPPDLVPNPAVAMLQALPPAPPPRKVVRPRPRKIVAQPRSAAPHPASTQGPTQPSIAAPEQAPAQDNVFPPPPPTSASPFPPPPSTR
ncbi:MAG: PEGA domain-containing protein [Xanthobacteraceae bacterium]